MKDDIRLALARRATLCILVVSLCACSNVALERRISKGVGSGDGATVRISEITSFSWSQLHVFPPYTPVATINADLGFTWWLADHTGIELDDGHTLLVFVQDGRVSSWLMQPRGQGDFSSLYRAGGYTPEEAVFVVKRDGHGWPYLRWGRA